MLFAVFIIIFIIILIKYRHRFKIREGYQVRDQRIHFSRQSGLSYVKMNSSTDQYTDIQEEESSPLCQINITSTTRDESNCTQDVLSADPDQLDGKS